MFTSKRAKEPSWATSHHYLITTDGKNYVRIVCTIVCTIKQAVLAMSVQGEAIPVLYLALSHCSAKEGSRSTEGTDLDERGL